MEPVYFPFTYIPDDIAASLSAIFSTTAVYQLSGDSLPAGMQPWVDRGTLRPVIPVRGQAERLAQVRQAYYEWAREHNGAITQFLMPAAGRTPRDEETSVSRIRSEISRALDAHATAPSQADFNDEPLPDETLFNAVLFLWLAQDYDVRQQAVDADLKSVEIMQRHFFSTLKGDVGEAEGGPEGGLSAVGAESRLTETASEYRIEERLIAWTHLLTNDSKLPGIFVTGSRTAMTHILENAPYLRRIIDIPCDMVADTDFQTTQDRQRQLAQSLERLVTNGDTEPVIGCRDALCRRLADESTPSDHTLTLYLAEAVSPVALFCDVAGLDDSQSLCNKELSYPFYTVVGLLTS